MAPHHPFGDGGPHALVEAGRTFPQREASEHKSNAVLWPEMGAMAMIGAVLLGVSVLRFRKSLG